MPFEPLDVENKHNRAPVASISYERTARKTKSGVRYSKLPSLTVSLPTTIAGVTKKNHFMLQFGTGKDAGKARIVGHNSANKHTVKPRDSLHAMSLHFGFVPMLGEDAAVKEFVKVRKISDDEFEIDLPAWFKPEAATPSKTKA